MKTYKNSQAAALQALERNNRQTDKFIKIINDLLEGAANEKTN